MQPFFVLQYLPARYKFLFFIKRFIYIAHLKTFAMKRKLLTLLSIFTALHSFSQKNFWKHLSEYQAIKMNNGRQLFDANGFVPSVYTLFQLNEAAISSLIKQAPMEGRDALQQSKTIIPIPVGDGKIEMFRIVEAPVMMPKLQAKYPDIHSYAGQSIDNPANTIRFDITPLGMHATIGHAEGKKIYINPVNHEAGIYLVNERNVNDKAPGTFICSTDGSILKDTKILANKTTFIGNADDGKLHTYRLALCVTGKWSQAIMTGTEVTTQDSINTVMSAITAYLVRANEVYERDLAIRLLFVDNEDALIFLNPNTDPFTTNLNSQCQSTCDKNIGDAGYDVGHVIDKGSNNGNAGCINCVCKTGSKGSGMTQYSNVSTPLLVDYFIIDYWTHEMGHQVGGNHTFTNSNEGTNAQIEPGSGSTIMGYAGITGSTDVQPHSDDYFSCANIAQISNSYKDIAQGGKCAVFVNTNNKVPRVNGGYDHIIPKSTPFVLVAKSYDGNAADVLTYCWEQIDVRETGGNTFPKTTSTKGPVFRSLNYTQSKRRYFPDLNTVLTGALSSKWEAVPSVARDLNFRVTVRDNHAGGGNNSSDDVLIQVTDIAGPFAVSYPNTAITKKAGDTLRVKWDVANTNNSPVNCKKVRIFLSTNGGQDFTVLLANAVPNNGSAVVTLPANKVTNTARIAVMSMANVFFDVSNADFIIKPASPTASGIITSGNTGITQKNIVTLSPNPAADKTTIIFNGNYSNIDIKILDAGGRPVYKNKIASVNAHQPLDIDVSNFAKGIYIVTIISDSGTNVEKLSVQ